jgi:hypothetical protein
MGFLNPAHYDPVILINIIQEAMNAINLKKSSH